MDSDGRCRTIAPVRSVVLLAAACTYTAGSFADVRGPFPGKQVTVGCIDLAIARTLDPAVYDPILAYSFGNHCHRPATVDLASVRVRATYTGGGIDYEVHAYDPKQEIRPLPIDGLAAGREKIEYLAGDPASITQLCADVGGIDPSVPRSERWVCTDGGAP